jgi:acetylornithine/succinyldiaminopimelate/putrescine aminotransferase
VAGLAVLDIIEEPGFLDRVRGLSDRFAAGLAGLPFQLRRAGLMMGFKLGAPEGGLTAAKAMFDAGLFAIYANHDHSVLPFLPPLLLADEEADEIVTRVKRALG